MDGQPLVFSYPAAIGIAKRAWEAGAFRLQKERHHATAEVFAPTARGALFGWKASRVFCPVRHVSTAKPKEVSRWPISFPSSSWRSMKSATPPGAQSIAAPWLKRKMESPSRVGEVSASKPSAHQSPTWPLIRSSGGVAAGLLRNLWISHSTISKHLTRC